MRGRAVVARGQEAEAGRAVADDRHAEVLYGCASGRLDNLRSFVDRFAEVVRLPAPDRQPCDVNRLIEDILGLVQPSLGEREIELVRETAVLLPPLELDQNQFEQVLRP